MKLQVGERLPGSGPVQQPGGYLVTGVVSETPWYGLYTGKKILYNFDFSSKRVRETDDKEWLDVYLRTIRYPHLDDSEYVSQRRALARAEVQFVLGNRGSNLWPEPIDLLEIANTRDPFTFSQAGEDLEPIVVFARPHGQLLGDWQQNVLPLASILSVLAELLEFLGQTHHEGLLLHGMGPASILVDRADRVHYVGTDMVIARKAPASSLLLPLRSTFAEPAWIKLFPPERFPRGFAAPECFPGGAGPDRRSDLYAWASLAYLLLTGEMPWQIALEQGRSWAHYEDSHFASLEKVLRGLPATYVTNWLEELGLSGVALSRPWPLPFLDVMRLLLSPDPNRRPGSVGELRRWLVSPPPPPVTALLAIRTGPSEARIYTDLDGLEPGLELVVRRGVGKAPGGADDSAPVLEGTPQACVVDQRAPGPEQPAFYAACTRRKEGHEASRSAVMTAELLDPTPANLMRLAEAESDQVLDGEQAPARVRLCFQALDPALVGDALLGSQVPLVRTWALHELLQSPGETEKKTRPASARPLAPAVEALLYRALRDPLPGLRLEAAQAILAAAPAVTDELVHRLVWNMGRESVDEALQAIVALHPLGLDAELLRKVVDRVEGERTQVCPVCGEPIAARERSEHLRALHDYVEVDGSLLPRARAVNRLWDQVFLEGNARAHERLLSLFGAEETLGRARNRKPGHAYVTALESALAVQRGMAVGSALGQLIQCLRQGAGSPGLVPHLLRSPDSRLREVAREVLLPALGEKLRAPATTPQQIRQALDQACPDADLLDEKMLLCYRLPQVGVEEGKSTARLAQLQEERLVRCGECEAWVRVGDLEAHLLAAHGICQFRGVRRPPRETRNAVLDALCRPHPDVGAWRMLDMLARSRRGEAERRLVTWLCQRLRRVSRQERSDVTVAVAEAITGAGHASRMLPTLLAPLKVPTAKWLARSLALEVAALVPSTVDRALVARLKTLLADRQFPRASKQRAVIGLLRTTGKEGDEAFDLLSAYVAQSGKIRALEKLRALEQQLGKAAALDKLYTQIEDQIRMACPRCATQLKRGQMVKHLWDRHRLMLDGLRAREPWRVLEDWVVDYRLEKDPALLRRCRDLAKQLDGNQGILRLQQLLLRHGVDDSQARTALLELAHKQQASLCPKCFHLVPVADPPRPGRLTLDEHGLRGHGFHLEISEGGPIPRLEIEGPDEILFRGREPGRWLTPHGALIFLVGPLILVSFVLAEVFTGSRLPALVILGLALAGGMFLGSLVYLIWPRPRSAADRLIDAAWTLLMPDLIEDKLSSATTAFLTDLAVTSRGLGRSKHRADALQACKELAGEGKHVTLEAALTRLQAEDLIDAPGDSEDPVVFLVEAIRPAFEGHKPLAFVDQLLSGLNAGKDAWPEAVRERLRVLLADSAFDAGLELNDLQDLAAAYPGLGAILKATDSVALLGLRYLWSLERDKPWERCGKATTVFDLAGDGAHGEALMGRYPHLLLAVRGLPIYVTSRGVWFKDVCVREKPKEMVIVKAVHGEGYYLVLGQESVWTAHSPEHLFEPLQRWLTYYFQEFLPDLRKYPALRWGESMRKLAGKNAILCPRCRHRMLACRGEVGINMEEEVAATWG